MSEPASVGVKVNAPLTELRWSGIRDMALAAEVSGLDSLWSEDHHFGPPDGGDPWDVWSVLAALAAATERLRLGPIVASLNFSSPLLFARRVAAVQEISGGRLVCGIGAGSLPAEYPKAGLPIDHPVSRFEEAFEIVRRLLGGERFDYQGEYWQLEDTWLSTPPEEPVEWMLGSTGPRMLGIALPHVEGWNAHWGSFRNAVAGFRDLSEQVDEACEAHGRDPADLWRSAEIYVQLDGAIGLPIDLPDDFPVPRGEGEIGVVLSQLADAGADLVQVLVDPQTPEAVERLGAVAAKL
ncbi:MAG: LLM class flavin-dependent oxidoreductase [Nitriliruptorales bacterium]|nr:LLM class flavin-dependent oxidoreductase [Nitriliruptorales bacterium]